MTPPITTGLSPTTCGQLPGMDAMSHDDDGTRQGALEAANKRHADAVKRQLRERTTARRERSLHRSGSWVSVLELIDWLTRDVGAGLGAHAYQEFWKSLKELEFNRDGRTRVLLLNEATTWARLNPERGKWALETHGWETFVQEFLGSSWIETEQMRHWLAGWLPRDLCQRWDTAHGSARPATTDAAASAQPTASTIEPTKTTPVSDRHLRKWYETRIEELTKRRDTSSGEDDWAAAQQYFTGRVTRARVRAIRNRYSPAGWRKQGRRAVRNKLVK
jgi:hypothetical protein